MCGRLVREQNEYARIFGFPEESETRLPVRFNIGPMSLDWMIRPDDDGRELVASRWGLIPAWAKERSFGAKTFNARAETLSERPTYRNLIAAHRCIIPASGFYEWTGTGKAKQPLHIRRADAAPLALAGLWATWEDKERGETVTSHTIITTSANEMMAAYHERMPVVLDGDALDAWLDPSLRAADDLRPFLIPCPDDLLTATPVSTLVNNVRNDGPELIEPLEA